MVGRKPLILVRAAIFGLLLPTSADPKKDREIFLKILTMDEEGLWLRKSKPILLRDVYSHLTPKEQEQWFSQESNDSQPKIKKSIKKKQRKELQHLVFVRLSYDEKLEYCDRSEQVIGPSETAWQEINAHLGTNANTIPELVRQLGEQRFGRVPLVGDAFSGGGSIPFEAARIGCEAYGSDLNPIAALLTWASLNLVCGGEEVIKQVRQAQQEIYNSVDRQITDWGIEHNEKGWRADAYLYCNETQCPECRWIVPIAPTWVIVKKNNTVAQLQSNEEKQSFNILIKSNVTERDMKVAEAAWTLRDSVLRCPHCNQTTPITMIRGDLRYPEGLKNRLRLWENDDFIFRPNDVFQERLYCIRWVEIYVDEHGKEQTLHHYRVPDKDDLKREEVVLKLLCQSFYDWQEKGYIPSRRIVPGDKTDEPIRTRGWTHWHHLFNARQLLVLGSLMAQCAGCSEERFVKLGLLLGAARCADYNARPSRWHPRQIGDKSEQVFSNQALNTLYTYATR